MLIWSLLNGDLGTASQSLILNTNQLNAFGNNIYLENRKDLIIDMILAFEELYLNVKGDLHDQQDDSAICNGIHANSAAVQVSGNIGMPGENVTISVNESLDITAKNLYRSCIGDVLVGTIRTDGMVSINAINGSIQNAEQGSGIWCDSLSLNAYGMIGTDDSPLLIHSNGIYSSGGGGLLRSVFRLSSPARATLMANSYLYGENITIIPVVDQMDDQKNDVYLDDNSHSEFKEITVTNNSDIRVTGTMDKNVVLIVSDYTDHVDCSVCKAMIQHHLNSGRLFVNLKLLGNHEGELKIEIPATEELAALEGQEIVVLLCRDGKAWAIRAKVINGYVTFYTEEVGVFFILGDSTQLELTDDGTHLILEQENLPFGGWL